VKFLKALSGSRAASMAASQGNQAGTRICRAAELNTAHVQAYTPKRKAPLKRG
jgi:hypothetical protein